MSNRIKTCAINGCDRRSHARAICRFHYNQLYHAGGTVSRQRPATRKVAR